jgi:hypothetical protein
LEGKIVLTRYIHTELANVTLKIFRPEDAPVLEYNEDDGTGSNRRIMSPIIPMALDYLGLPQVSPHASHASILSTHRTTLEDSPYLKIFNPCLPSTEDSRDFPMIKGVVKK